MNRKRLAEKAAKKIRMRCLDVIKTEGVITFFADDYHIELLKPFEKEFPDFSLRFELGKGLRAIIQSREAENNYFKTEIQDIVAQVKDRFKRIEGPFFMYINLKKPYHEMLFDALTDEGFDVRMDMKETNLPENVERDLIMNVPGADSDLVFLTYIITKDKTANLKDQLKPASKPFA